MFVVICFDVSRQQVRRRLTKLLQQYGWRVQYSVFEVHLRRSQFNQLQQSTEKILEPGDRVVFYPLCGKDIGARKSDGCGQITWAHQWYVIDEQVR
ncbi:CRISPR-associated endonuclease Cas2 [Neiella sp. HB171785]|uniref:CRISPR-associated endoribonuclease Cas2 n=1 Tax=Neiella litorisoli TaxID=2771431 RepID=A0A8J6UIW3_9GAMM|nr:CRISPR-associated endonuclease Cas2 [Neiella litorisoli]MBD1389283.1 CRISPR-associated endonuclease Cas2 [Neiella litorisoli]